MDALFALAMVKALTDGPLNFTAINLSTVQASLSGTTIELPKYVTLFLQTNVGSGQGDSFFTTPATYLMYPGFNQNIPILRVYNVPSHNPGTNIKVTESNIIITSLTPGYDAYKYIGSIIAIT